MFDQTELVANRLDPIYDVLLQEAANVMHYYLDNSSNGILEWEPVLKPQRNGGKMRKSTGIYTKRI